MSSWKAYAHYMKYGKLSTSSGKNICEHALIIDRKYDEVYASSDNCQLLAYKYHIINDKGED